MEKAKQDVRIERFKKALEKGFRYEAENSAAQYAIMQHLQEVRKTNPDAQIVIPQTGQVIDFVEPEHIQKATEYLKHVCAALFEKLEKCETQQQMRDEIFTALQSVFHASVFYGKPSLTQMYLMAALEKTQEVYAQYSKPKGRVPKRQHERGIIDSINDPSVDFWQKTLTDMLAYVDVCVDAGDDLMDLATMHLEDLQSEGLFSHIDGMVKPFQLAVFYREQAINGCEVSDLKQLSLQLKEAEATRFAQKVADIIKNDLFAPFNHALPSHVAPEMAWFIGRCVEIIRRREAQCPSEVRPISSHNSNGFRYAVIQSHTGDEPERLNSETSEAIIKLADTMPIRAANDNQRSSIEILKDPECQREICDELQKIFSQPKYKDMAYSIPTLLAAKTEFANKHQLKTDIEEDGPSRY